MACPLGVRINGIPLENEVDVNYGNKNLTEDKVEPLLNELLGHRIKNVAAVEKWPLWGVRGVTCERAMC